MILRPRLILQQKTLYSETKTDDSETKNDCETKKNDSETKDNWKPRQLQECYLQERYCPHPMHPPIWRRCHVECRCRCAKKRSAAARTLLSPSPRPTPPPVWRRCHAECSSTDLGCRVMRILVAESSFFLVAASSFFGCGIVSDFGCGIDEIWLRNRRKMVAESDFTLYQLA